MTLLKKDVVWALCSLMDGMKEHEIQEITGLPMDACEAIWSVYIKALAEVALTMAEYRATTTEITLHPVEIDPLSHRGTRVQLSGTREAGYFIQVEQEDQCIELDPEELPHLLEACEQLLRQTKAELER